MNMSRLAPYLSIVAALAFFIVLIVVADRVSLVRPPFPDIPTASSTLTGESGFALQPLSLPSIGSTSNTSATSAPKRVSTLAPKPAQAPTPIAASVPVPVPPPVLVDNAGLDAAATALRAALVNIICYVPPRVGLHSISGSGVFIDPKGIILTNAHIAQYFLLADKGANCTIRSGSPAIDTYKAALIYISPAWLKANASVLTQTLPSGTGEYDFAFLAVSKSANDFPLPSSFPALSLATTPPDAGTPVVIATFGAQFLASSQVQSSLFPTIVFGSVKDVFTFGTNTIDVLALGGSAAAQEGSSGGGVADASGKLVGTITTSTVEGATDTRSLDAITASYLRADYASETGQALDLLLAEDTATAINEFTPQIPALEAIITVGLP